MNESDIGKVFLVALPWDWTIVGRFAGYRGNVMLFEEAGYFTRTGATFDILCAKGFAADTKFHPCGEMRTRADPNVVLAWKAAWPQRSTR